MKGKRLKRDYEEKISALEGNQDSPYWDEIKTLIDLWALDGRDIVKEKRQLLDDLRERHKLISGGIIILEFLVKKECF